MPRYIVKMEREDKVRYMEWSTVVDAPVTYLMPLDEFKAYYRDEHGRRNFEMDFEDRMARVEEKGTSARLDTLESLWEHNRAGDDETPLTEDQIWVRYHDERPKNDDFTIPKRGDLWRHYKGTVYFIEGKAKHSETQETLVLYRPNNHEEGTVWARPLSMWHDEIKEGQRRFEPVTK